MSCYQIAVQKNHRLTSKYGLFCGFRLIQLNQSSKANGEACEKSREYRGNQRVLYFSRIRRDYTRLLEFYSFFILIRYSPFLMVTWVWLTYYVVAELGRIKSPLYFVIDCMLKTIIIYYLLFKTQIQLYVSILLQKKIHKHTSRAFIHHFNRISELVSYN